MPVYELDGAKPEISADCWIAPDAVLIGKVRLLEGASIWFGAVLRGDNEVMAIGRNSNVQDMSMLHSDPGCPLTIGENVTIGHQVMLHGCTIGDNSLIGIQAVVLNNAKIGRNSIVGAGSVVTEGKEFPDNSLIFGSPAKVMRTISDEDAARLRHGSDHYVNNAVRYAKGLKKIA
jgi:carbonic anhydrase/acetyltransferase-like protein (isoleucine patch superfamily)